MFKRDVKHTRVCFCLTGLQKDQLGHGLTVSSFILSDTLIEPFIRPDQTQNLKITALLSITAFIRTHIHT